MYMSLHNKPETPVNMSARIVRCFFFFQAEDGIRDIGVTGVQTCALPISRRNFSSVLLPFAANPTTHLADNADDGFAAKGSSTLEKFRREVRRIEHRLGPPDRKSVV